ncbi:MAG: hypothetical protein LR017_01920 [Candidatus Pacebacteria bacterium]|nr:hypothetical protein [Candidatus Paceibacterota bacterium]
MHHAQLLIGDFDEALATLETSARTPSADVSVTCYTTFGIADARQLKQAAHLVPVQEEKRIFVVGFRNITTEAQNALLKLFEDPPHTAQFYVVSPQEDILLPTLRSRLQYRASVGTTTTDTVHAFLTQPVAARLAEIADRNTKKDTAWFDAILAEAAVYISEGGTTAEKRAVLYVQQYVRARSASKKMLLEHMALSLTQR